MFKRIMLLFVIAVSLVSNRIQAQQLSQTIRGTITDKAANIPLPGANVVILSTDPLLGTASDKDGNFKISKVPVGKYTLRITYLGYKEILLPNIILNSGKEVVLTISMDENFVQGNEIVISYKQDKSKTINEMTTVSARTFSMDETQKYAAAVNDPGRMASSFAGVIAADDGNNNISIRGNSPSGLLWRMEGVEIPNPNHFAVPGASGGGISILSAQVMSNSDFMTGAFPAEYGNALSGVFDIKLRKGNNEKTEFTVQAGFLGLDVAAEGPFKKGYKGSYLINYRYSTLSVLSKIGVNVGAGTNNFQDISFNVFLPTERSGAFSLFGFGGLSSEKYTPPSDSLEWEDEGDRYSSNFISNTGAAGLSHSISLGKETSLKSVLLLSGVELSYQAYRLDDSYSSKKFHDEVSDQQKITVSTTLNHKFNARHSIRSGVVVNRIGFNVNQNAYDQDLDAVQQTIDDQGKTFTMQLYTQSRYYLTPDLTLNTGLHYFQLAYNNSYSIEPRAAVKYEISSTQSVSLGYGLHSQLQPVGAYFAKQPDGTTPNEKLGFSKSHHLVVGYDRMVSESLRFKAETYYQYLYNIPVQSDVENSFSMVNVSEMYVTEPLDNEGIGRNYGLEITLEQFMKKNYYFLCSGSLYDSKYKGSDGVLRNSRYNGNYGLSFTAGKEINTGSKFRNRIIGLNIKTIYRGGFRDTPIDLEASAALPGQGAVYIDESAYSIQYPAYFRIDMRVSVKRNRPHSTHTLALDIQNVTNYKNIYGRYYSEESNSLKTYYQTPLIPVLSYKIEF